MRTLFHQGIRNGSDDKDGLSLQTSGITFNYILVYRIQSHGGPENLKNPGKKTPRKIK